MSIINDVKLLISKFELLKLLDESKLDTQIKTSKFNSKLIIKNVSKFMNLPSEIKSDLDIQIPMDVELWVLSEGKNRDGMVFLEDMVSSLSMWGDGVDIIPYHGTNEGITKYNLVDELGVTDRSRIGEKDNKKWIVVDARITNRNVAYQMYLRQLKNEPIEISAEYMYSLDYDNEGNPIQTNLRPGAIALVNSGHIMGNKIKNVEVY